MDAFLGLDQKVSFVLEQPFLAPQTATITDQLAVFADDAMAGYDDGDRVAAVGGSHGPYGCRSTDTPCNILIGCRAAIRNRLQALPDLLLEFGSAQGQADIEFVALSLEIFGHLLLDLTNIRVGNGILATLVDEIQFRYRR